MSNANRIVKYDILRIVACACIVLLHVASSYLQVVPVESGAFSAMATYDSLTRFAVPVFMMLSGMFLLKAKPENIYRDSAKRFFKLFLCFYIWSAFYAFQSLAVNALRDVNCVTDEMVSNALERFAYGHYHMWFIWLVLEFYLLRPIIQKICSDEKVMEYFLALWIGLRFILPLLQKYPPFAWTSVITAKLSLLMITGYMGYFMLGYYLSHKEFSKKTRYIIYFAGFISMLYTVIKTIVGSRADGQYTGDYCSPGTINILLFSTAVFCLFRYSKMESGKHGKFIGKLSGLTLFIYLIHPFFLEKLNMIGITTISFNAVVSVPALFIMILAGSALTAYLFDLAYNGLKRLYKRKGERNGL